MADTTNVGEIAVEIVAKTEKFEAGMKSAGTTVNSFSEKASKYLGQAGDSLGKFELSGKGGKRVIEDMAVSAGIAGGPIGSLAGSIIKMGPALGLAVAGFELYNKVMAANAEAAENAVKNNEAYAEIAERVGRDTGKIATLGPFGSKQETEIKNITKHLADLHKQQEEGVKYAGVFRSALALAPGGLGWLAEKVLPKDVLEPQIEAQKALAEQVSKTTDRATEELKILNAFKTASASDFKFKEAEYEIKITTKKDSIDRIKKEILAITDYNKGLKESLSGLPEGGESYNAVLDKIRENYVKILDAQESIAEKTKRLAEESHKAFMKGVDGIGKLAQKANEVYEKWKNPAYKAPEVQKIDMVKTGFAAQLDTSRVSAAAMRMADTKVQKVTDPALELTNQYLKTISTASTQPQIAVTA